jgi:ubiquinone/menaquinone biosynthesis C-methylase UbiE
MQTQLARLSYFAQRHSLALTLGAFFRGTQTVISRVAFPSRDYDFMNAEVLSVLQRRFQTLISRDWENPRSLLFDFAQVKGLLKALPMLTLELPAMIRRSREGDFSKLPSEVDRERYPKYYLRTFHWQRDGWFSRRSAKLYDASVDVLFQGAADVMRRMVIPPLKAALANEQKPRILDVACGTGRFLRQLRAAFPKASITGIDLSPHYIAHARQLLENDQGDISLVVDNAEAMPMKDESYDAVTCVFLFHELPKEARRNVMKEIARVLKPGGTLSISDSAQLIDSEEIKGALNAFHTDYHEPYYKGYIRDPLEALVQEAGLELVSSEPHYVSKTVVAKKRLLS